MGYSPWGHRESDTTVFYYLILLILFYYLFTTYFTIYCGPAAIATDKQREDAQCSL